VVDFDHGVHPEGWPIRPMRAAPLIPKLRIPPKEGKKMYERYDTVIIGGGQAGLATGYYLARQERPFVILDAFARAGDAWRTRWSSLRLFTPAKYDGLPGMAFPATQPPLPTKDEMADYLEAYATRFELPLETGVRVNGLGRNEDAFVVSADNRTIEADRVVVATGANQTPRMPPFAAELDPRIIQLHSSEYRGPEQLRDGGVLVVGAGNSGGEIAFELAKSRPTWLSGRNVGEIPVRAGSRRARVVLPLIRFTGRNVLTARTSFGRKLGTKIAYGATPLIRIKNADLIEAGVVRVPRVTGVENGLPVLEDGQVLDVPNVVWCTGFRQDFSWIDLPIFTEDGLPAHRRGIVQREPGLYFVGLLFQYSVSSDVLPGIGRDARYVAAHIARQSISPAWAAVPRLREAA
jgi:putative flavoprotein involved in K+ transport